MDAVTKLVYRSLLRSASKLDSRPALQALLFEDPARSDLPIAFKRVLANFLSNDGQEMDRMFRLPDDTSSLTCAVQDAFRSKPVGTNWLDSCFLGMRYLSGICQAANNHKLLPERRQKSGTKLLDSTDKQASRRYAQVAQQSLPEKGCILVSHPMLYHQHFNFFYQTVVLICEHSLSSGTYGLTLNRMLSKKAAQAFDQVKGGGWDSASEPLSPSQATAGHLDLARDLPLALQAYLDAQAQLSGKAMHPVMDVLTERDSEDDAESASGSDSDGVHVTFEGSDNAARSAPQQQADELPSTRQASGQTPWHARIKPQVAPSAEQQSQSPPDVTGDIADPRHPLRFHNVVSNLKRDKYPGDVSSLEEDRPELDVQRSKSDQQQDQSYPPQDLPQGQAPMAAQEPQQAPSSEAMQQSSPDPAKDQPDLQHAQAAGQATAAEQPDQQAGSSHQEASSESNWLDATASDVLQHSTAQPQSTAHDRHSDDSALRAEVEQFDTLLQRTAENPKLHHLEQRILRLKSELGSVMKRLQHHNQTYGRTVGSAPGPDPMSKGETDSGSSPVSLNDLYAESDDKTLSKGGPVPAGQILHDRPELGGQTIQEPSTNSPGLYLGSDFDKLTNLPRSQLGEPSMRFFVGEAVWSSQQLEAELAQGQWILLAPDQALLRRICMDPQSFDPRADDVDGKWHERVREKMWSHVMREAGSAHQDFCAITKALVKDLQQMQY